MHTPCSRHPTWRSTLSHLQTLLSITVQDTESKHTSKHVRNSEGEKSYLCAERTEMSNMQTCSKLCLSVEGKYNRTKNEFYCIGTTITGSIS